MRRHSFGFVAFVGVSAVTALGHAAEPLPSLPASSEPAPASAPASTPASAASVPEPEAVIEPQRRHQGFYLHIISSAGYMAASGTGPLGSPSVNGFASGGGLAVGGTPAPGLAIAGTISASSVTGDFSRGPWTGAVLVPSIANVSSRGTTASAKATLAVSEVGLLADWYPDPKDGWHAGASAGLAVVGLTNQADASEWAGASFGGSVFGGYAWWIGAHWSLGAMLAAHAASTASLMTSGGSDTGYRLTPWSLGVETSILYY